MKRIHCHFPSLQWSTERGKKYNTNWKVYEKHDSFPVGRLRRWWLWRFLSTHVEIFRARSVCVCGQREKEIKWPIHSRNQVKVAISLRECKNHHHFPLRLSCRIVHHYIPKRFATLCQLLLLNKKEKAYYPLCVCVCVCVSNSLLRNR